jgi:hypothetical protein
MSVSGDETGAAAEQSAVPALCQKSCCHPKHLGIVLPYDGKRTLANIAVASPLQHVRHSRGTPSRELERLSGTMRSGSAEISGNRARRSRQVKKAPSQKSQPAIGLAFDGS